MYPCTVGAVCGYSPLSFIAAAARRYSLGSRAAMAACSELATAPGFWLSFPKYVSHKVTRSAHPPLEYSTHSYPLSLLPSKNPRLSLLVTFSLLPSLSLIPSIPFFSVWRLVRSSMGSPWGSRDSLPELHGGSVCACAQCDVILSFEPPLSVPDVSECCVSGMKRKPARKRGGGGR